MNDAAIASVKSAIKDQDPVAVPTPDVRRFVRKSALLTLGIVSSALVFALLLGPSSGEAVAVLVSLTILLVWVLTFLAAVLVLSFANTRRIVRLFSTRSRRPDDLADAWLDGPG